MRKRCQLVHQRTAQILSIQNQLARSLARSLTGNDIKRWVDQDVDALPLVEEHKCALKANLAVMHCLDERISALERVILAKGRLREEYKALKTVSGIGDVLALTIALEIGEISRFASPGQFAPYARMVESRRESNGKTKGSGKPRCGNKHLSWAFVEAAHFAARYDPVVRQFYQPKCRKTLSVVAIKAVAHKLARACFHMMRDGVEFDASRSERSGRVRLNHEWILVGRYPCYGCGCPGANRRNVGARREGRRAGRRACNRRRVDGPQRALDLLRG
jgi:transposase